MIISIVIFGNSPTVSYEQGSMLGLVINREKSLPGFILRFSSIVAELLTPWQCGSLENASGQHPLAFTDFFQYHHFYSFKPLLPTFNITCAHPSGFPSILWPLDSTCKFQHWLLSFFHLVWHTSISMSILHLSTWTTMTTPVCNMIIAHSTYPLVSHSFPAINIHLALQLS